MGKFGWSYPAGCDGPPDDGPLGCDVCGEEVGQCRCPECPDCGTVGRKACYTEHALRDLPLPIYRKPVAVDYNDLDFDEIPF